MSPQNFFNTYTKYFSSPVVRIKQINSAFTMHGFSDTADFTIETQNIRSHLVFQLMLLVVMFRFILMVPITILSDQRTFVLQKMVQVA